MSHLTADEMSAQLDGALTGAARERAERHLAECDDCRAAVAALAAQEDLLRPALEHDPGDAYFETFAARVEDRIRAAGLQGAQARQGNGGLGWLRSPRRLAWVGAVAVTLVGAGVVLLTTRVERPDLESFDKSQPQAQAPATPSPASVPPGAQEQRGARSQASAPAPEGETQGMAPGGDETGANALREADRVGDQKKESAGDFARSPRDGFTETTADRAKLGGSRPPAAAGEEAGVAPAKDRRAAGPRRLVATRRTAAGEDVPLQRRESGSTPVPAPATAPEAGAIVKPPATPAGAAPAEKQGFASTTGEADRALAPQAEATPAGPGSGSLCGSVVDGSGHPVARARVTLVESGASASTDERGRFCLVAVPGDHEIAVMAIGFRTTRLGVRSGPETAEVVVTLPAVSVLGDTRPLTGLLYKGAEPPSFAKEPADLFSALPDSLRAPVREAQRMVADGRARRSAARLDQAAAAWEAARSRLSPGALEAEARFRLAEARHLAWQAGPNETRRAAATTAARDALRVARLPGEIRSLKAWLAELER